MGWEWDVYWERLRLEVRQHCHGRERESKRKGQMKRKVRRGYATVTTFIKKCFRRVHCVKPWGVAGKKRSVTETRKVKEQVERRRVYTCYNEGPDANDETSEEGGRHKH